MTNNLHSVAYAALLEERRRELRALMVQTLPYRRPFVWEVGCGHGHFLTAYARTHPAKWCVGVDIAGERIERALRKRDRAKLANLHFIRTEAGLFLECLSHESLLSELFVLFPDPWPKLRHHKHRIMQPTFLTTVATRAAKDCRLYFRTDYEPYFNDTSAVIDKHARWRRVEETWPFEYETVFQSRAAAHRSLIARLQP